MPNIIQRGDQLASVASASPSPSLVVPLTPAVTLSLFPPVCCPAILCWFYVRMFFGGVGDPEEWRGGVEQNLDGFECPRAEPSRTLRAFRVSQHHEGLYIDGNSFHRRGSVVFRSGRIRLRAAS